MSILQLYVEGMFWQKPGEKKLLPPSALTAGILCSRHNHALSPLDEAAGHTFKHLADALGRVVKSSISRATDYFLLNGEAFELWALKTLLGLYHSKIARIDGSSALDELSFNCEIVRDAFGGLALPEPSGLYVNQAAGSFVENKLGFAPLYASPINRLAGLRLIAHGLHFDFLFDPNAARVTSDVQRYYRPLIIDLWRQKRASRLILSWNQKRKQAQHISVEIAGGRTFRE